MIKLMATDMDGTFLRDDMTYDEARFALLYQQLQLRASASSSLVVINTFN